MILKYKKCTERFRLIPNQINGYRIAKICGRTSTTVWTRPTPETSRLKGSEMADKRVLPDLTIQVELDHSS